MTEISDFVVGLHHSPTNAPVFHSCSDAPSYALRLSAALVMVTFPRLVSPRASTTHRPRRLPSVQPASSVAKHHRVQVQSTWADRRCLPVSDGDGDGAMVVTAFTAPSGSRASTRSRRRSRCSPAILIEADGGNCREWVAGARRRR